MLKESIDRFFYQITACELRLMNRKVLSDRITYNSLLYLDLISCMEPCTASQLAELLQISKPAVTAKLRELIQQGLVQKNQSPDDRRIYYLTLTPGAARTYRLYSEGLHRAAAAVSEQFSEDELCSFCRILDTLTSHYTEELCHGTNAD